MDEQTRLFKLVMRVSGIVADEIMRRMNPVSDQLSQAQAWKIYGKAFVRSAERSGLLTVSSIGNRKVFSKTELDAYLEASNLSANKVSGVILNSRVESS